MDREEGMEGWEECQGYQGGTHDGDVKGRSWRCLVVMTVVQGNSE